MNGASINPPFGNALSPMSNLAAYGSTYYDSTTPLTLTTTVAGTFYKIASNGTQNISDGDCNLVSIDVSTGHGDMTVLKNGAGEYRISYHASYSVGSANQTNTAYVYKNGSPLPNGTSQTKVVQASQIVGTTGICQTYLNEGDVIDIRAASDNAGGVINAYKLAFVAQRIPR